MLIATVCITSDEFIGLNERQNQQVGLKTLTGPKPKLGIVMSCMFRFEASKDELRFISSKCFFYGWVSRLYRFSPRTLSTTFINPECNFWEIRPSYLQRNRPGAPHTESTTTPMDRNDSKRFRKSMARYRCLLLGGGGALRALPGFGASRGPRS